MSNETFNISDYTWQSYQEGDKVMIRPVNPYKHYDDDGQYDGDMITDEWKRFDFLANQHTYHSTGIEPGIEIEGDRLELIKQVFVIDHWMDLPENSIINNAGKGKFKHQYRQIIRYKEVTQPSESKEVDTYKGEAYYKQYTGEILEIFYYRFYEGHSHLSDVPVNLKKEAFFEWLNEQIKNTTY